MLLLNLKFHLLIINILKLQTKEELLENRQTINILKANGIYDVEVEMVNGRMTDHYDPRAKKLRLSQEVYFGTSIAAVGIASHEVGHAIQHNVSYTPLILRNAIVPAVNFGAGFSWILFFIRFNNGYQAITFYWDSFIFTYSYISIDNTSC